MTAIRVVYHFNLGLEQASNGLRNIRNHLLADPTVKIVVVAHAAGIDFLLNGATENDGGSYSVLIEELARSEVEFLVCNNTLKHRGLAAEHVHPSARIIPAGVAEIARLQAREGFVYIKP